MAYRLIGVDDRALEQTVVDRLPSSHLLLITGRESSLATHRGGYTMRSPYELRLVQPAGDGLVAGWYRKNLHGPNDWPVLAANGWLLIERKIKSSDVTEAIVSFVASAVGDARTELSEARLAGETGNPR